MLQTTDHNGPQEEKHKPELKIDQRVSRAFVKGSSPEGHFSVRRVLAWGIRATVQMLCTDGACRLERRWFAATNQEVSHKTVNPEPHKNMHFAEPHGLEPDTYG